MSNACFINSNGFLYILLFYSTPILFWLIYKIVFYTLCKAEAAICTLSSLKCNSHCHNILNSNESVSVAAEISQRVSAFVSESAKSKTIHDESTLLSAIIKHLTTTQSASEANAFRTSYDRLVHSVSEIFASLPKNQHCNNYLGILFCM